MSEYQVVNGWRFPVDVNVPESQWSQTSQGDWTLGWQGYVDIAHQKGLEDVDTTIIAHGEDPGMEMPWVAARAEVVIDGERYAKIGSTDSETNGLEDIASTAESKALARAIRVALNIMPVDDGGAATGPSNRPDDFDPDDGHALSGASDDAPDSVGDSDSDGW